MSALVPALLALVAPLCAVPPPSGDPDEAAAVAALFEARCAGCHAPGAEEPKALRAWDGARDLAATAASDLIVAGDPDDSDLVLSVEFEDMPPADSGVDPCTPEEVAALRAWVAAGAPAPSEPVRPVESDDDPPAERGEGAGAPTEPRPPSKAKWIGRLHPLVVHFPIALLAVALLAELLAVVARSGAAERLRFTATFCLSLGAVAAVPSAALGWIHAEHTSHRGEDLDLHRWLGVSLAVASLVALFVALKRPRLRVPVLLALGALVAAAGHTGGVLTYGADWLVLPS